MQYFTNPIITSGTTRSPNIDLNTATAFAMTTSSGRPSNLTASSPNITHYVSYYVEFQ